MADFQDNKLVQGSANIQLIEDPVEGSNGTAVVFRINQFISAVEDELNQVSGGIVSYANYNQTPITLSASDYIIGIGQRTTAITLNLPNVTLVSPGKVYIIRDESNQGDTYPISLDPFGSNQIEGTSTYVVNTKVHIYSNGTAWFTI
jgi:hypothetical protein